MSAADKDAEEIYNACKGLGTREEVITNIICHRNSQQRQEIAVAYKTNYGEDIIKTMESELSGDYLNIIKSLLMKPRDYDATLLHTALHKLNTDETVLTEVIASRPPHVLKLVKDRYKQLFNEDLEEKVSKECSGDYKKYLISLLQCNRSVNENPDIADCEAKAKQLYEAGEKKRGTDEEVFGKIILNASQAELKEIEISYITNYGHSLMKAIDSEFSGDEKSLLKAVFLSILRPCEYIARRINKAISGLGTDEDMLIRQLVFRDGIRMDHVRYFYKAIFNKDMVEEIADDVSGDFGECCKIISSQ